MKLTLDKELLSSDIKYLKGKELIGNDQNEKYMKILLKINFYKRSVLLQSIFEYEAELITLFVNNLAPLATLPLNKMNRKTIGKYFISKRTQEILLMVNEWFGNPKRNYKVKHKKRRNVDFKTAFTKMTLGQKIILIDSLKRENKLLLFKRPKNYNIKKRLDILYMMTGIRNYLSHEYWVLDTGWVKGIIYNENSSKYNKYRGSSKEYFNELSKCFNSFEIDIVKNAYKISMDALTFSNKYVLYKNRKKFYNL